MRDTLTSFSHLAMMAAIVATLAYFPFGILLALVLRFLDIPFDTLLTFDGALGTLSGLLVWWLLFFAGACAYSAWMFPWSDKAFAWPDRK